MRSKESSDFITSCPVSPILLGLMYTRIVIYLFRKGDLLLHVETKGCLDDGNV